MEETKLAKEIKPQVQTGLTVMPLIPTDIESCYRLAKIYAQSGILPAAYNQGTIEDKASKAFVAIQLGAEIGLLPLQALQSIAVINGTPALWGDGQKALVLNSPLCEDIEEFFEGEWKGRKDTAVTFKAVCIVTRSGKKPHRQEFSIQDAKDAGLWQVDEKVTRKTKEGKEYTKENDSTWYKHPKRMLANRARAFALRDRFPDVLKGLSRTAEELLELDPPMKDVTPKETALDKFEREHGDNQSVGASGNDQTIHSESGEGKDNNGANTQSGLPDGNAKRSQS